MSRVSRSTYQCCHWVPWHTNPNPTGLRFFPAHQPSVVPHQLHVLDVGGWYVAVTVCERAVAVGEEEALVIKRAVRPLLCLEHGTEHNLIQEMMTCEGIDEYMQGNGQ